MVIQRSRVAAYAVCLRDEQLLLARYVSPVGQRHWTLPGGKVEHAEDPFDAVVREVAEETGYDVRVDRLLGVDSRINVFAGIRTTEQHNLGVFYEVSIVGGELRHETNGSTDLARWVPVAQVRTLERFVGIDIGLELHRGAPPGGHVAPIPVTGLLRH